MTNIEISDNEYDASIFAKKYFPDGYKGVYVDVGAGFPERASNSSFYRKLGWQIIAIEPQAHMCNEFRKLGYDILQYAAFSKDIGETSFQICTNEADGMGGSTFEVFYPEDKNGIINTTVEAYTLNTLLEKFYPNIKKIDILDIDVEYNELPVLFGIDLDKYDVSIMIIELLIGNPDKEKIIQYLNTKNYIMVDEASHNKLFIKNTINDKS